jgi:4a-hydroxytetrahydrobiopterin dehydratase
MGKPVQKSAPRDYNIPTWGTTFDRVVDKGFAMVDLAQQNCVPCRSGDRPLPNAEIYRLLPRTPGWRVKEVDRVKRLERVFRFKDFEQGLEFTKEVAELAKTENHHPRITMEYGTVTLTLWTHKVRGLHNNDFIMAAKIDNLSTSYRLY